MRAQCTHGFKHFVTSGDGALSVEVLEPSRGGTLLEEVHH